MAIVRTTQLIAASLALQSATPQSPPVDPTATARTFLETLASNPSAAESLGTTDALIVVGDIGGPLSQFLREVRPEAAWLATCRVASLELKPSPTEAELNSDDTPPWMKGGNIALVGGVYSCTRPDGATTEVQVSVVLRNERVAAVFLWQ